MNREEQAALDVVLKFMESYSRRNVDDCMKHIAASKAILLLGTNDNEVFKTAEDLRSALQRDFGNMADIRFGEHRNLCLQASPTLASVLIELPISYWSEAKEVRALFRYALTLAKEDGQWKICAGIASVPFAAGMYAFP